MVYTAFWMFLDVSGRFWTFLDVSGCLRGDIFYELVHDLSVNYGLLGHIKTDDSV